MKIKYKDILYICKDCGEIYRDEHYSITQEGQCPKCRGEVASEYHDEDFLETVYKYKDKISFTKKEKTSMGF